MKKIYLVAFLAMGLTAAQAQTVKIMKDGQTVASYSVDEYDAVVFTADEDEEDTASAVAGTYTSLREVTMAGYEMYGVLISDTATLTVTATGTSTVSVDLPECYYAGHDMTLPGYTVTGVKVTLADGVYTLDGSWDGTASDGATTSGTISGTIVSGDTWEITVGYNYGSMPHTLNMVYTPLTSASAVAGTYSADREVTLVEMPAAGVVVADTATITITASTDSTVEIVLPSCTYGTMELPGVTVSDVEVYEGETGYTISTEFSGTTDEGKSYSGSISATIVDSDTWEITETMKYGSMPYTLSMVYTPAE